MNPRPISLLKSPPQPSDGPSDAVSGSPGARVGGPKVAARQGVVSALRSNPLPGDGRYPVAWLSISSPRYGHMPTAASQCQCGWNRSAIGHAQVAALIGAHTAHRDTCPLRTPQEGRAAA